MSFPRYPTYKDSGVEWLGAVPGHWDIPQIKRTTYLKARVGWKGLTSEEFREQSFAYLVTGSDFREKFVKWDECYQVEQERYDDDPFIQLQNGDLLITKDGTIGKLAIVSNLVRPACLNSGIFVARPRNTYTTDFMYWILSSNVFSVFCDLESFGSTINHLYQNVFERFAFPAPPESEQTQIAAFLDRETAKIDELVIEQQRLMELLKEKRQAVISHAVTRGLNPNAPMKPSGIEWLGEVPAHWEVVPFSLAINFQEGPGIMAVDFHEEGIPLLRVSGVQGRWATLDGCNYLDPKKVAIRWNHFRLEIGDLVISASASMGTVCEVGPEAEGAVPYTGLIRLTARNNAMTRDYIRAILGSVLFHTQIDLLKAGTTIQHFGPTHLQQMRVLLPSLVEQDEIASFVALETAKFDTLTAEAQRAIDLLQERRTALISAAVTGQIDVRGVVERTKEAA